MGCCESRRKLSSDSVSNTSKSNINANESMDAKTHLLPHLSNTNQSNNSVYSSTIIDIPNTLQANTNNTQMIINNTIVIENESSIEHSEEKSTEIEESSIEPFVIPVTPEIDENPMQEIIHLMSQPNTTQNIKSKGALLIGYAQNNEKVEFLTYNKNEKHFKSCNNNFHNENIHTLMGDIPQHTNVRFNTHLKTNSSDINFNNKTEEGKEQSLWDINSPQFKEIIHFTIFVHNYMLNILHHKNIIELLFIYCNIPLNHPSFKECNIEFEFPSKFTQINGREEMFDYPETYVENVSDTILNQPALILMIGCPGSGKSTFANQRYGISAVIEADQYFTRINSKFKYNALSDAHQWVHQRMVERLNNHHTCVIANTHCQWWQLYSKIAFAITHNISHKIVFHLMPEKNIKILLKRNTHEVPQKILKQYIHKLSVLQSEGPPSILKILSKGCSRKSMKLNSSVVDIGLYFDNSTFNHVIQWYLRLANCETLLQERGDGRMSPQCEYEWKDFKENMHPFADNISKFKAKDHPCIAIEVKVKKILNHKYCQMIEIEILYDSIFILNGNENVLFLKTFVGLFEQQILACVLSMKCDVPFENAKNFMEYNYLMSELEVHEQKIFKAYLTTKNYARNFLSVDERISAWDSFLEEKDLEMGMDGKQDGNVKVLRTFSSANLHKFNQSEKEEYVRLQASNACVPNLLISDILQQNQMLENSNFDQFPMECNLTSEHILNDDLFSSLNQNADEFVPSSYVKCFADDIEDDDVKNEMINVDVCSSGMNVEANEFVMDFSENISGVNSGQNIEDDICKSMEKQSSKLNIYASEFVPFPQ